METEIPRAIRWQGDREGHVVLIDQTLLPERLEEIEARTPEEMVAAIRRLAVRGAPAIGVAAAFGVCLASRGLARGEEVRAAIDRALMLLAAARPTAVNLGHMLERMRKAADDGKGLSGTELRDLLLDEARAIQEEDHRLCAAIGEAGLELIGDGCRVLTHCNAGALATAGEGTALAVLYAAKRRGRAFEVIADETRPLLQGVRLTAWELERAGIPVTVICDSAAAHFFGRGDIDIVITGADRVAANGDAANKIGTYGVACLARHHGVPFYIAAPSTTFDFASADGSGIPIEERDPREVWRIAGEEAPPAGIQVRNPAFDVTPGHLIEGWITEKGILQPPFRELDCGS